MKNQIENIIELGAMRKKDVLKYIPEVDFYKVDKYLDERYTAWKLLLNWENRGKILNFENRLGVSSLSLSTNFSEVKSVLPNKKEFEYAEKLFDLNERNNIILTTFKDCINNYAWDDKYDAIVAFSIDEFLLRTRSNIEIFWDIFHNSINHLNENGVILFSIKNKQLLRRVLSMEIFKNQISSKEIIQRLHDEGIAHTRVIHFTPTLDNWRSIDGLFPVEKEDKFLNKFKYRAKSYIKNIVFKKANEDIGIIGDKNIPSMGYFSLLQSKINEIESLSGVCKKWTIRRVLLCNPCITLVKLCSTNNNCIIAKMPMDDISLKRILMSKESQIDIHINRKDFCQNVPKFITDFELGGYRVFLEEGIIGSIIEDHRDIGKYASKNAIRWLTMFQKSTIKIFKFQEDDIKERIFKLIDFLSTYISKQDAFKLELLKLYMTKIFLRNEIPMVHMHGDFKIENIVYESSTDNIRGVIDWDLSSKEGWPLVDVLYFLVYSDHMKSGKDISCSIFKILNSKLWTKYERDAILEYCKEIGLSEEYIFAFGIIFWLHHILIRYAEGIKSLEIWKMRNIESPLAYIVKRIGSM